MSAARQNLITYKLAYVYAFLYSVNALGSAIVASFMNVEWESLSSTSKFLLFVVILQSWTGTMLAFLNKTLARIQQGESPIPMGDTTMIVKTEATTTTTPKV